MGIAIPLPGARAAFSLSEPSPESSDFLGPLEINSLLSNVQTTYGSLLGRKFLASMILTTIFPFGGTTAACAAAFMAPEALEAPLPGLTGFGDIGAVLLLDADVELGLDVEGVVAAVEPFKVLPVDAVPRGVAGGVSFPSEKISPVSLLFSLSSNPISDKEVERK